MLIKYDPVIPADPRLVISHRYEVRVEVIPVLLLVLMISGLGRERSKDNHLSRSPGVDFSDFRLWTRFVWEQSKPIEHVRCPEREL